MNQVRVHCHDTAPPCTSPQKAWVGGYILHIPRTWIVDHALNCGLILPFGCLSLQWFTVSTCMYMYTYMYICTYMLYRSTCIDMFLILCMLSIVCVYSC